MYYFDRYLIFMDTNDQTSDPYPYRYRYDDKFIATTVYTIVYR